MPTGYFFFSRRCAEGIMERSFVARLSVVRYFPFLILLQRRAIIGLWLALLAVAPSLAAMGLTFHVDDMTSPAFQAREITVSLQGAALEVRVGRLRIHGHRWRQVRLSCPRVQIGKEEIACPHGVLTGIGRWPLSFYYWPRQRRFVLRLAPLPRESWRLAAHWKRHGWAGRLTVVHGRLRRWARWLPTRLPKMTAGTVDGVFTVSGGSGLTALHGTARFNGVAFSDASGLHAGDKLGGKLRFAAQRRGKAWRWTANADWRKVEVFWQPLYFAHGGQQVQASGRLANGLLQIDDGTIRLADVGAVAIGGVWPLGGKRPRVFSVRAHNVDLAGAYKILLQPFLANGVLGALRVSGRADAVWRYANGATQEFDLDVRHGAIADRRQRFAVHGIDADAPWSRTMQRQGRLRLAGGQLLHLAVGPVSAPFAMQGWNFSASRVEAPLLDGKLVIDGFQANKRADGWSWRFHGELTPISMKRLSHALSLAPMHGALAGVIPDVRYQDRRLTVDGALLFNVFDGTAVVKRLTLLDPLGLAPRLTADVDMRNLDLNLLTRTFAFGHITGRIDAQVSHLVLSDWRPVQFDAVVRSSAGDYPKRISQKAVENISALGGAGAAAAIQRSFLRFFDTFGYDKIGLSCVLRQGVCRMGGVANTPHGYIIVKGGGIPAITVIGYNRAVGWDELLNRLRRITQGNLQPVVR
ncbi:MAG TPA: hypothetical protein DEP05_07475 [Betaproteobacteria bacterium]|nr:hypothetical protein [Betaproteobacteria bacterium]